MISNINIADAEKQAIILEAEGAAQSIIVKAEAQAAAIEQVELVLNQKSAKEAA